MNEFALGLFVRNGIMNSYSFKNRPRGKRALQIYLEYREKIKRCLQFSVSYLLECLFSVLVGLATLHFDRYHLIHCSQTEYLILNSNLLVNALLYFKLITFVYLFLLSETERVFSSLPVMLTIIFFEFTCSLVHMGLAFLEMVVKTDCYKELFEKKIIFPNDLLIDFFTRRTNAQISIILHVVLSVLVMHNLLRFIRSGFGYIQLLKMENEAFEFPKTSAQV